MRKSNIQQLALVTLMSGAFVFGASSAFADGHEADENSKRKMDMSALDTDKDGMVSMDEGVNDGYVAKNFKQYDGNGDGMLDEAEFAVMDQDSRRKMDSITESFGDLDTDGNGSLSKEELASNEMSKMMMGDDMEKSFADMDLNNDGQIDDKEAMDFDSRRKQAVES